MSIAKRFGVHRMTVWEKTRPGLLSGRGDDLDVTPLALEITHPGRSADFCVILVFLFRRALNRLAAPLADRG
jgi:hypothetical protein